MVFVRCNETGFIHERKTWGSPSVAAPPQLSYFFFFAAFFFFLAAMFVTSDQFLVLIAVTVSTNGRLS